MSTTTVILIEAVRDSLSFGHTGDTLPIPFAMAAGTPGPFQITFPSSDWATVGHTISCSMERSLDGGVTWGGYGGFVGARSGGTARDGGPPPSPSFIVSWDGLAMQVRAAVIVNAPFSWGVQITH